MNRTVLSLSTLPALLLILWSCGRGIPPGPGRGDPTVALESLAGDTWTLYDRVLRFTPDSLYEQIDGRAELYLSYDVVSLTYASFDSTADPTLSISVSVYDMGRPLDAFGIFSVERSPGQQTIDLGRAAYRSDANYYVWHGRYYITVVSTDPGEESARVGLDWARQVVASLPDAGEPVPGLDLLPKTDLTADSVRYVKVDAMGLEFMRDTFTGQYRLPNGPVTAFVSRRESPDEARSAVDQYREFANRYGQGTEPTAFDGVDVIVCDMADTTDVVAVKGNVICGVTAAADRDQALRQTARIWQSLP